jgi:hypothetical protein
MEGSTGISANEETSGLQSFTESAQLPIPESDFRLSYAEKRKKDNRERQRRCRARQAELLRVAKVPVPRREQVEPQFLGFVQRRVHRTSAILARQIGMYAAQKLKDHGTDVQHLTIAKLLGQGVLKDMVPPSLRDPAMVKMGLDVLGSFKDGLQTHLVGLRKDKSRFAKNIVTTLAVAPGMGSQRGVAGLLGVDRRNIKKALARRVLLDNTQDAFWLGDQRRVRINQALSEAVKRMIIQWWKEETTVSPNRKDITRKWIAPKLYIEHPTHYLQVSQVR